MNNALAISRAVEQMPATQRGQFEQAMLRVVVPAMVLLCFAGYWLLGGELSVDTQIHALWFVIGFFLLAVGMMVSILAGYTNVSVVRRYLGIVADIVGNTYFMIVAGELGAAVFVVYLFVTFGNGFRYDRVYSLFSQALSLVGFATVYYFSDFWSRHGWFVAGAVIAMLVLPNYVGFLTSRIEDAKKRAEDANRRAEAALQEAKLLTGI